MLSLATQFVQVNGSGRFNKSGNWTSVSVESIESPVDWGTESETVDLVDSSNVTPFDEALVVTADEPFDVDEFVRLIHGARDVGLGKS